VSSFADEIIHLKSAGTWSGGGTPSKANPDFWNNGEIPWVSPKDMKTSELNDSQDKITAKAVEASPAKLVPAGSVLMVVRSGILAHTFPVAIAKIDVTLNQDMKAITPKPGIRPEFLAHQLRALSTLILKTCTKSGTTVASVETKQLQALPIWVPPTEEQDKIVNELEAQLSRLNKTVSTLQGIQAKLKQARASILKAAVEGKLVETEGDWNAVSLQSLLREPMRNGKSAKTSPTGHGVRITTLTAATTQRFSEENTKASILSPEEVDDLWMKPGDIFVQRSNTPELVGSSVLYAGPEDWAIFPDLLIRLRCSDAILPKWMLFNLQAPEIRNSFKKQAQGSAGSMPKISQSVIANATIQLPPVLQQTLIISEVERRFSVLDQIETTVQASLARCGILRQAILKRAFEGRLVPAT
jgi:type I restriction enzyme S subunit